MAEAKVETPAKPALVAERKVASLNETEFYERGVKGNTWEAVVANDLKPDDLLRVEYWTQVVARKLRPFDTIHAMNVAKTWYVELIVFATYVHGAVVKFKHAPIVISEAAESLAPEAQQYEIFDGGLGKGWGVKRIKDNRVMMCDGSLQTREMAQAWLSNWLRAQHAA